jgi:hypothetical protein
LMMSPSELAPTMALSMARASVTARIPLAISTTDQSPGGSAEQPVLRRSKVTERRPEDRRLEEDPRRVVVMRLDDPRRASAPRLIEQFHAPASEYR